MPVSEKRAAFDRKLVVFFFGAVALAAVGGLIAVVLLIAKRPADAVGYGAVTFIALVALARFVTSIQKTNAKARGKNRCTACKSRLKFANGSYATVCAACGTHQPA
jgi:hypothetical protein